MKREDQYWTDKDGLEFLRERMASSVRDQLRELENLRDDMRKAREYISKCKQRYMKDKLKKKSMAEVNADDMWKDLEPYNTRRDIENFYGFDGISAEEFDRLIELWDLREEQREKNKGKPEYEDNITVMLDWAMNHLEGAFKRKIEELEETEAIVQRDVREIVYKHNEQVRQRWE